MKKGWKIVLILLIAVLGVGGYFGYKIFFMSGLQGPEIIGDVEKYTYEKAGLGDYGITQDVKLQIYLPPNYNEATSYPMIFVLDGDDMFDGAAGYLSQMINDDIVEDAVLVGIGYGYLNGYLAKQTEGRWRDYSFPQDPQFGAIANGPNFYRFLAEKLVPEMMERYHGIRNNSTLIGHSMGGDFTFYAFLQYDPSLGSTNPFTNFIIGDGGDENGLDHNFFLTDYAPAFEARMTANGNQTHVPLTLYRVWGYKTNADALDEQEAIHTWISGKNYLTIRAYRYYPLADDHAATMKTTVVNGMKVALGKPGFLDYSDSSSYQF